MLLALCSAFPDAPIYTLFYDKDATGGVFEGRTIRTSFLQKFPFVKKYHRNFPLLMPLAVEQFDFSDYDLVVSISASFAKGVITKPNTKHICICLTPPRFLWDDSQKFVEEFGYPFFIKAFLPPFITYLRIWDKEASHRVDEFWGISKFIQGRIKKYYGRESDLIYPPVDVSKFSIGARKGDYFLMAGRLVAYKRFDLGIKAFNALGLPLKIVGIGPEMKRLKKMAGDNIEFLGQVPDGQLAELYAGARAFIFPQEEDFGIVPLEAMASGCPVIAYGSGGALETVVDGVTGVFFGEQTVGALKNAVMEFEKMKFNPAQCRTQAEKFDVSVFRKNIVDKLQKYL